MPSLKQKVNFMAIEDESFSVATREIKNGITIVDIKGDIDISTTSIVGDHLKALISDHHYRLLLNLKDVTYVSSAGWGLFISLLKKTRENEGDIKLICLNEDVYEIFKMLSFSRLFFTFDNEDDALSAF